MRKNLSYYLLYISVPVLFFSCTPRKKMIYFQGDISATETIKNFNPVFHTDDLLSITVMSMDPETVKPFNFPATNTTMMGSGGYSQGTQTPPGYLIDVDGNIDFPLIGKIKLAGLTRSAVIDSLKLKLKPYLSHPTIVIRILNFKVTVLGEVRNPGTFNIPNERITLPEALGIAGDLLITGKRKNVLVIRDQEGKKTKYN
ncbi:MAG: polysaccharide biosynthesis/export family protein, partial [Flavobacterium sp.]